MSTTKTLMLTALTVLSLGAGAAMAQESAGGYIAGPFEQRELLNSGRAATSGAAIHADTQAAPASQVAPQYGSSDRVNLDSWPVLEGGDGAGG
jgi:hypothetical protein